MKNEHLYKKLKYELTLNYLYNTNKYHRPYRQTIWNICKYFNIEFTNQRYSVIHNFSYSLAWEMNINKFYFGITDELLIEYASTHNLKLYDTETHKLVNHV